MLNTFIPVLSALAISVGPGTDAQESKPLPGDGVIATGESQLFEGWARGSLTLTPAATAGSSLVFEFDLRDSAVLLRLGAKGWTVDLKPLAPSKARLFPTRARARHFIDEETRIEVATLSLPFLEETDGRASCLSLEVGIENGSIIRHAIVPAVDALCFT